MTDIFPELIKNLPEADVPIDGITAYLSQGPDHQILFMQFTKDVEVPEHAHGAQWGVVLEGTIELMVEGKEKTYSKGDRFYILKGEKHSAKVRAGYCSMECFEDRDRYKTK